MEPKRITAATLMEIYGVSRPTALNWFSDRLIEGERGQGVTDKWFATAEALKRFHQSLTCINVWEDGKLINLPAPFTEPVKALAELTAVSHAMAHRYLRSGYVPGAIKLPYANGDWKLPKGFSELALRLKSDHASNGARIATQIGSPLTPLPDRFTSCG